MTTIMEAIAEAKKISHLAGPMCGWMSSTLEIIQTFVEHPTASNRWDLEMRVGSSARFYHMLSDCTQDQRRVVTIALGLGKVALEGGVVPYNEIDPQRPMPEIESSTPNLLTCN